MFIVLKRTVEHREGGGEHSDIKLLWKLPFY